MRTRFKDNYLKRSPLVLQRNFNENGISLEKLQDGKQDVAVLVRKITADMAKLIEEQARHCPVLIIQSFARGRKLRKQEQWRA